MKLKIEKEFKDKYTGETYVKGDVISFEDSRAEEILADNRRLASEFKEKPGKRIKK